MAHRLQRQVSCFVFLLLLACLPARAAEEEPGELSTALSYQPPVYMAETISLIDAVRLALEHQPNIRLQSEDELLKSGLARQATGQFDTTFAGNLEYKYEQQELTEQVKKDEREKRDFLATDVEELDAIATEAERRSVEFANALEVLNAGGDLRSVSFEGATDQANWDVLVATIENAPSGAEDATEDAVRNWLEVQVENTTEEAERSREEQQKAETLLRDLGAVPSAEENYSGSINLELSKQYRTGPTLTPFLKLSGAGTNYKGKPHDDKKGGKGGQDNYKTVIGFKVDIPLGRGRGIESTGAPEKAAQIDYEASLATTTHTASTGVLQTVQSYWRLVGAQQRLQALERSLALNERILELSRGMVDADEMPRAELARALAREAEARAQVEEGRRALYQARLNFVTTVGLQVADTGQAPLPSDDFPEVPPDRAIKGIDVGALTVYAFDERRDYHAARLLEESGRVLYRAATLDIKRQTDLNAEVSYSSRSESTNAGDGMWESLSGTYSGPSAKLGLVLDWPIQNNAQLGKQEQQRSRYNQTAITTRDLARLIQSRIVLNAATLEEVAARVRQYREAVEFYREAVEAEIEKFQLGLSRLIDTIFTEQNQISAELALVDSRRQYAELLAQLRFESATILEELPEGWVVNEDNLIALPVVGTP
jgi:outer membrane protein TolC